MDVVDVVDGTVEVVEVVVDAVVEVVDEGGLVVVVGVPPCLCFEYFAFFEISAAEWAPQLDLVEECRFVPFTYEAKDADAAKATQRTNAMLISRFRIIPEPIQLGRQSGGLVRRRKCFSVGNQPWS